MERVRNDNFNIFPAALLETLRKTGRKTWQLSPPQAFAAP